MTATEHALTEVLTNATFADADALDNFAAFPIFVSGCTGEPGYLRLEEALPTGRFRVTEVSEGGSVPELLVVNELERPVLLLDGEELAGAKQNRIVNLTILIAASTKTTIPVSCVEQGRWHRHRPDFQASDRVLFQQARAYKAAGVTASLRSRSDRRSDQSQLWDQISAKQRATKAYSDTGAVDSVYEKHRSRVEELVGCLNPRNGQCGVLFAIDGRPIGLELFDSPTTLRACLRKLGRGYALDAFDRPGPSGVVPTRVSVEEFFERVRRTPATLYPGVGVGEDLRLDSRVLAGGALVVAGKIVHAGVFTLPLVEDGDISRNAGSGRPWQYRWQ